MRAHEPTDPIVCEMRIGPVVYRLNETHAGNCPGCGAVFSKDAFELASGQDVLKNYGKVLPCLCALCLSNFYVPLLREIVKDRQGYETGESPCPGCGDAGGAARSGTGQWVAIECEGCYKTGTYSLISELNKRDIDRATGVRAVRLKHPASSLERAFHAVWCEHIRPHPQVNCGHDTLKILLNPAPQGWEMFLGKPAVVHERDYKVAATIIQWLGTNCGQLFLSDVQAKHEEIKKAEKNKPCAT